MSAPLRLQLQEYSEFFEAQLEETSVDVIVAPNITVESRRLLRRSAPASTASWRLALAAAAGVLVGGVAVFFWTDARTDVAPVTSPTTTATTVAENRSPDAAPATTQVVTADTVVGEITLDVTSSVVPGLGTLTWERITGDETTLPQTFVADPSGGFTSNEGGEVWRSEDAVTWTLMDAAPELSGYEYVRIDGEWALAYDRMSSSLFRLSQDEWVAMELPHVAEPETTGLTWTQGASIPIESGEVSLINGSRRGVVPWEAIYGTFEVDCGEPEPCEIDPYAMWESRTETFRVDHPGDGDSLAELAVSLESGALVFTDVDSNAVEHIVTGSEELPIDEILAVLKRDGQVTLAGGWVSSGGAYEWVDFPFEGHGGVLALPGGGFASHEFIYDWQAESDSPLVSATTWTSVDGVAWVDAGEPSFVDPDAEFMMVQPQADALRATVVIGYDNSTGMEIAETWTSTDGTSWTQIESVFPPHSHEYETTFGRVVTAMPQGTHLFWVSVDGVTWFEVEGPPGSHEPAGAGYAGAGAGHDILYTMVGNDGGSRTLWIGRFEDQG